MEFYITMEFFTLISFIILYSLIQSVFGIGLLVFGTPTMLLMGYSYTESLWILIPPSLALSLSQVLLSKKQIESKKDIYIYTISPLIICLIVITQIDYLIDIKKIVGLFLLLIVFLRTNKYSEKLIKVIVSDYRRLSLIIIGAIHGLSNLGGGPLSAMMSIIHSDKETIKVNIAFVYFIFALSQLTVLFIIDGSLINYSTIIFIITALSINFAFGKRISESIDKGIYNILINIIALFFAIICLL